nr:hypothetical protein [Tanacetum cinerariifolium]
NFITELENLKDLKIKREFSNAWTPQQNGVAERRNRTLIEAARTMLADAKLPVTFWAEAVNTACTKEAASQDVKKDVSYLRYIALPNWFHEAYLESSTSNAQDPCKADAPESSGNSNPTTISTNPPANQMKTLTVFEDILGVTTNTDDSNGVEADLGNMEYNISASPTPTFRIHKDHSKNPIWVEAMQEELLQFKIQNVWTLVNCPKGVRPIGTKWVLKNKNDVRGIVIRNKVRLVAQRHTYEEGIDYSLLDFRIQSFQLEFTRGTIDHTLFIRKHRGDFILVQVYVDDIIFGSSNLQLCREFEALMHEKFQMSAMDVRSANTPMDKENP